MDVFAAQFVEAAYEDCRKGGKQVRAYQVRARAVSIWCDWRDEQLVQWANCTLDRVPHAKLSDLVPVVGDVLAEAGEYWEYPDDEDRVEWVAWGIACLRWINQEWQARVPSLEISLEEVKVWLESAGPPRQLALF